MRAHLQLDLDPEMVEALDSLNVHGYAAYAMARDLVAQKQHQAQVRVETVFCLFWLPLGSSAASRSKV